MPDHKVLVVHEHQLATSVTHDNPVHIMWCDEDDHFELMNKDGKVVSFHGRRMPVPLLYSVAKKPEGEGWVEVRAQYGKYDGYRGFFRKMEKQ